LSVIVAADRLGLSPGEIAVGFRTFRNVRRRLEVRGEVAGVLVYDDFAHHPTAVRETLGAVRQRFPEGRIWAVFEPRSQTSRRSVFESDFARALAVADIAVIAPVFMTTHIDPGGVLSPERVRQGVLEQGREAYAPESTGEVVSLIVGGAKRGDHVVVMSNGGFDNIHERLLDGLRRRRAQEAV
jgi:UDP-N-acetylmuramate: L-alanyl-gamma-D-glutamyl-meso-diaminopimelate ligase